jgi:hypothetical protein
MNKTLIIGMIGTDTSHAVAFTELLNDFNHPYHVPGGRVAAAFPGGSPDFELSASRVGRFAEELSSRFGVALAGSPEEIAEACDAVLLESADGRVHLEQFRRIIECGKPVFIDKPLALSVREAEEIADLASRHGVPVMSCSALRYAAAFTHALAADDGPLTGADCFGPITFEPTQPGYFWYGIHAVEMLFAAMGGGCRQVSVISNPDHDLITALWEDGRIGTVRGNRLGNSRFGALLHDGSGVRYADITSHPKPFYASLLEQVMGLFQSGKSPVPMEITLEIIRFVEAANQSRQTGAPVKL